MGNLGNHDHHYKCCWCKLLKAHYQLFRVKKCSSSGVTELGVKVLGLEKNYQELDFGLWVWGAETLTRNNGGDEGEIIAWGGGGERKIGKI